MAQWQEIGRLEAQIKVAEGELFRHSILAGLNLGIFLMNLYFFQLTPYVTPNSLAWATGGSAAAMAFTAAMLYLKPKDFNGVGIGITAALVATALATTWSIKYAIESQALALPLNIIAMAALPFPALVTLYAGWRAFYSHQKIKSFDARIKKLRDPTPKA